MTSTAGSTRTASTRRTVATVGVTVASVALLTWGMVQFDGLVLFRQEWQLPYLALCVVASALGGRMAWVTALVCSGLALFVFGLEPQGVLSANDPAAIAEAVVFVAVTAVVIVLVEARTRALTLARDVDEVRRSEDQLRTAFEALMDPTAILEAVRDADRRIVDYRYLYASRTLLDAVGDRADHLVGSRMREVFPEVVDEITAMWDHVVETGEPLVRNDVPLWSVLHQTVRRLDLRGGRTGDGLVFTYRDRTEDYEAAARLRRSERLYRILSENTDDAVFTIRRDDVTWASPSSVEVLGWRPDEMIGRPWADFMLAEDAHRLTELQPFIAAGERVRGRARYLARDGSLHWGRLDFAALHDEDGEYQGMIISGRRIDDEVAAEEELAEAHRQRDRLIEQLPVGVFRARVSHDGVPSVDLLSARTFELMRATPDEPFSMDMLMGLIHPDDVAGLWASGQQAVEGQQPLRWEGRLREPEPPVWLRIEANVDATADGIVLDGLIADITLGKQYEDALGREAESAAQRADLLAEVDKTKSALLAALSHDLRTPLAVISSAAAALKSGPTLTAEEEDELLSNIEDSGQSLSHLLTNLLDQGRVEAGTLPVHLGSVDVIELLEEPLRHAGDGVELDLPDDLACVEADPGLLERVLDNLLLNAQRHRPPGTVVTVAAEESGDGVRLQVVDHGSGVPEERYHDMFVPFQRLDDRGAEGIGLGLSIARAFTEAMGGTLTPSATPGGGLTMTIELKRCHVTSPDR